MKDVGMTVFYFSDSLEDGRGNLNYLELITCKIPLGNKFGVLGDVQTPHMTFYLFICEITHNGLHVLGIEEAVTGWTGSRAGNRTGRAVWVGGPKAFLK